MLGISRPSWTARVATALATVSLIAASVAVSAQSPAPSTLTVEGAWTRVSPMMGRAGAAYMVIKNSGTTEDALVSVTTPAANIVELHETKDDGSGQMMMSPVEAIVVPAGGMAELKPGSFHVMLIDLVAPLEEGGVVDLVLTFQSGATLDVAAPVGDGPAAMGPLTVEGAWARVSPMMGRAGAAYMVIKNSGTTEDALVSVTTPAANIVELHETKDDGSGQMMMSPVEAIVVPAGGMAELKPGSFHVMLIDLVAPLEEGGVVDLVLTFQSGATLDVAAPVGDGPAAIPMGSIAPASAAPMGHAG